MKCETAERKEDREGEVFIESGRHMYINGHILYINIYINIYYIIIWNYI